MITFESMGKGGVSSIDEFIIGARSWGLQPTYGYTASDMGVKFLTITFTWS